MQDQITQEYLKSILFYNDKTGLFIRKVGISSAKPGDIAGRADSSGYIQISVKGRRYMAHRIAWLYVHGKWPKHEIDHINRCRSDNRLLNLREATSSQNNWNYSLSIKNTSGFIGVSYDKFHKKYKASIRAYDKQHHIGYFDTANDAHIAYMKRKQQIHII